MNKYKRIAKKLLALICSCGLLLSICEPLTALAYIPANVTEVVSSDFADELSYSWTGTIENNVLTVDVKDLDAVSQAMQGEDWSTWMICGSQILDYKKFSGSNCTVSEDLSKFDEGLSLIYIQILASNNYRWRVSIYINVEDGVASFYSPYGQAARYLMDRLNENYDPEDFKSPATYNGVVLAEKYEEIIAKAKELTEGCSSDMEKIKAIHEWICTNLAYDREAYNSGDIGFQNSASWVFENKRAVCGGFASLAELMYRAVGIPCLYISGIGSGSGLLDDGTELELFGNHSWNAIYYNNSWHYIDETWDCENTYYGEGNEKNTSGQPAGYHNFGMPAELFGVAHYTIVYNDKPLIDDAEVAKTIKVTDAKNQYTVGDEFSDDYKLYFVTEKGTEWLAGTGVGECSGYDMNQTGTQTITVSYRGFETTFDIVISEVDEDNTNETKPNEGNTNETKPNEGNANETKPNVNNTNETKLNENNTQKKEESDTFKENNESIEKTVTILPKGTKFAKLKAGKKKLVVKVKASKDPVTGYQIRYSTKKTMKGAKTVTLKNNKLSKVISKLKGKKTYYLQVRTYKNVSGKNYYSEWSKIYSKKTKK